MNGTLLGIDAGTSNVKICAFGQDGTLRARASRPVSLATPRPRWAELDLDRYWEAVTDALREVIPRSGPVMGIGIATTCPLTVLLDEAGRPLRPGIPFLDTRATADVAVIGEAAGGPEAFFRLTGNRLSPSTCSAGTVRWVIREEPRVWARTARIGFLNSFLAARLTGNVAADWTQASYSGLFRLESANGWDGELVRIAGIPERVLPPVLRPFDRVGGVTPEVAASTGLRTGTPVAIGAADTAAAAFALGIEAGGECFESSGTSGVITFCLDRPDFDDTFLNRCHVVPGRWLAHGAMSAPGAALAWLREKVWPDLSAPADLERLAAASEPGARGLVFLPYMAGERSPIWDPAANGAWIGLRLDTTRADMARAVYEATAYGLRQILERGVERWGYRPEAMLCVGGGTRSALWLQIKADVMGIVCRAAELPDAAALGAAMLGGIAAGVYSGIDDPDLPKLRAGGQEIRPGPAERRQAYERTFAVYRTLYPALRHAMHMLAQ
ncbi:xylulokinase [Caldinitratiruptor microaerophilus]|uniref:Carbohydrate kinase n=1 Tax=Caldinitratiruptor microaerophilus TaxID=671077 RepID=A0AA35CKG0_9FIRM|nr:FGGY family carbohydrate kinase [Caldinitratiruptor microaerophilus]BDG60159.1 carbohydrate kinase [Caldinitratiruptor microaerophilus]